MAKRVTYGLLDGVDQRRVRHAPDFNLNCVQNKHVLTSCKHCTVYLGGLKGCAQRRTGHYVDRHNLPACRVLHLGNFKSSGHGTFVLLKSDLLDARTVCRAGFLPWCVGGGQMNKISPARPVTGDQRLALAVILQAVEDACNPGTDLRTRLEATDFLGDPRSEVWYRLAALDPRTVQTVAGVSVRRRAGISRGPTGCVPSFRLPSSRSGRG
jgi:hypothetical protein